ncbi:hypothetical protein SESBI_03960 [Sesbania bispinosa]|nr:hypothetical protein SESBI_03960 [Sesbania bispinosa]
MKIFGWMQKKLNGNNGKKKPSPISATNCMLHEPCKQEFSDWPHALLAIGTFGNNKLKGDSGGRTNSVAEDSSSFQDCTQELTLEEVGNLENELSINLVEEQEENPDDLINERLYSEDSNLEPKGKETEAFSDGSKSNINGVNFYPSISLIHSRGRDLCFDSRKSGVGKKSLFFLLKKMFVCKSGFQVPSSTFLKDPLSTESRMEKILRAILHKKIYPQGSHTFIKKYLENNLILQSDEYDEEEEFATATDNGSKWVKTDSECAAQELAQCLGLPLMISYSPPRLQHTLTDLGKEELPQHMTCVSEVDIRKAQKAERDASDLKGTMRKRMEFLDFD